MQEKHNLFVIAAHYFYSLFLFCGFIEQNVSTASKGCVSVRMFKINEISHNFNVSTTP
jgi:hypothetical protein